MNTYIVRVIDNYSHKIRKEVIVKATNSDYLRKRVIKDMLNNDVVLEIFKMLKDHKELMGSMWSIGKNVEYRVATSGNRNSDTHLVNPKTGRLDEIKWRD